MSSRLNLEDYTPKWGERNAINKTTSYSKNRKSFDNYFNWKMLIPQHNKMKK